MNNPQSIFSIVTPSYNQLDWLRLCVASVRDQIAAADGGIRYAKCQPSEARPNAGGSSQDGRAHLRNVQRRLFKGAWASCPHSFGLHISEMRPGGPASQMGNDNPKSKIPPLAVEHIIQDAGTPGIEEFAREIGADFYKEGELVFRSQVSDVSISRYRIAVYCESDSGMYDAVNKGYARASGEFMAYLNCDEQYLPGTLEQVREWFNVHRDKQVLFGDAIVVNPDGSYLCSRKVSRPRRFYTLVSRNLSIFTAATFIRKEVYDLGIRFDTRYKAVGDAVWALELLDRKATLGLFGSPLAVFTDTGENMNIRPHARREKDEMFRSAPVWARRCRLLFIFAHRLNRFLLGAYSRSGVAYSIFTMQSPEERRDFQVARQTQTWRHGLATDPTKIPA